MICFSGFSPNCYHEKKAKTDEETPSKSPHDIQLEQVTNTFNVAITLLGLNRRRFGSVMSLVPRDVCREIVKMTFPKHLEPVDKEIKDDEFLKLISKTPLLKSVNLGGCCCAKITSKSVKALAKRSPGLEWIKCYPDDNSVEALATDCPHLKHIDLFIRHHRGMFSDRSLKALENCRELTSLTLDYLNFYSFEALIPLIQKLTHLKEYKGYVNNELLMKLAEHCPGLTDLELHERPSDPINDEVFKIVAPKLFKIQSIALRSLDAITNETLYALGGHCHELESVTVERCVGVTDQGAIYLTEWCNRLQSLSLDFQGRKIGDETVYAVNKNLGGIKRFSVLFCNISDDALIAFAKTHPQLTHLRVGGQHNFMEAEKALTAFAIHCHDLVEVVFDKDFTFEESVEALIKNCPHLKRCVTMHTDRSRSLYRAKYPNIQFYVNEE